MTFTAGRQAVPEGPGLGLEIDEAKLIRSLFLPWSHNMD